MLTFFNFARFLTLHWDFCILLGFQFCVWIISNYTRQKQWKTFAYNNFFFGEQIGPWLQQINSTWALDPIENQLFSGPMIWYRDTGQRISYFDRCQLITTWKSNIKKGRYKPRLQVSVKLCWNMAAIVCDCAFVAVLRTRPRAIPLAIFTMRKVIHGFFLPSW